MESIELKNFKSFRSLGLKLKSLNLLTGINSSGKSSLLQAILLIRQSFTSGSFSNPLKKPAINLGDDNTLIKLGTLQDIFNEKANKDETIQFIIHEKEVTYSFSSMSYESLEIKSSSVDGDISPQQSLWIGLNIFSKGFQYLSSERISPVESYPNPPDGSSLFLGAKGEYAPYILENYGNRITIDKSLLHANTRINQDTLLWQVNYWLGEISKGIEVTTKPNTNTNTTELIYNYRKNSILEGNRKPQNVGYGITPALPILVALLISKPGDIVVLENPETHLHPYGQACIASLISKASQLGVQIILETHSDHIINGVLVSCKEFVDNNGGLDSNNLKVFFFDQNAEELVSEIVVEKGGKIMYAPKGFFDQISIDRRKLMGF